MARKSDNSGGSSKMCFKLWLLAVMFSNVRFRVSGQLDENYYVTSCPNVEMVVNAWLAANVFTDPTGPAALIRMVFHDCQVGGCDASIFLDTNVQEGISSELLSSKNFGIKDTRFIDSIKSAVEQACPGVVSCADILAMAARDCISLTQGPFINIPFGRKDGMQASNLMADLMLPPANISVDKMLTEFGQMGMTAEESVAILGAHTVGVGHCVNVLDRIYPTIDPDAAPVVHNVLTTLCPTPDPQNLNNDTIIPIDTTSFTFDNQYFVDVQSGNGLFKIDSNIAVHPISAPFVTTFANSQSQFFDSFSTAFVKLVTANVLTGSEGEVRKNCHSIN